MRNDSTRTNAVDAYPVAVQRRLIELLLTVAPDAPVPLTLLENIIAIDSITEGPTPSIADNVALVPSVLGAAVGVVESVRDIQRNMNRDTLTITASAQEQLRQQYAALGLGKRRRRQARDDIPASVCLVVEMYNAASFLPEADTQDYTHDQLALLVPHLLHLIQTECADISGSWGPVQSMTTLWLLNDHGVVAQNDVAAYTHRVMAYCEPRYSAWNELLTVGMFAQAVEEMIEAGWEEASTVGGRALAMAEDILSRVGEDEERAHHADDIAVLRQRLAAL